MSAMPNAYLGPALTETAMLEFFSRIWCVIAHQHHYQRRGSGDWLHLRCGLCKESWVQPR